MLFCSLKNEDIEVAVILYIMIVVFYLNVCICVNVLIVYIEDIHICIHICIVVFCNWDCWKRYFDLSVCTNTQQH